MKFLSIKINFLILNCLAMGLIALSFLSHQNKYFPIDLVLAKAIQSFQVPGLDILLNSISWPGYPPQVYYFSAIPIVIYLIFKLRWEAILISFSVIGIGAFGFIFKFLVNRPRPDSELLRVIHKGLEGGKYSFPAGHVQSYVAIGGFLVFLAFILLPRKSLLRNVQILVFSIFILLIGVSRVYTGEHWPSDALGGYLVGLIWLLITINLYYFGQTQGWRKKINGK